MDNNVYNTRSKRLITTVDRPGLMAAPVKAKENRGRKRIGSPAAQNPAQPKSKRRMVKRKAVSTTRLPKRQDDRPVTARTSNRQLSTPSRDVDCVEMTDLVSQCLALSPSRALPDIHLQSVSKEDEIKAFASTVSLTRLAIPRPEGYAVRMFMMLIGFPTFQQWVHKVNWSGQEGKNGLPLNLRNALIGRVSARYSTRWCHEAGWRAVHDRINKRLRSPCCLACYQTTTTGCGCDRFLSGLVRLAERLAEPASPQPAGSVTAETSNRQMFTPSRDEDAVSLAAPVAPVATHQGQVAQAKRPVLPDIHLQSVSEVREQKAFDRARNAQGTPLPDLYAVQMFMMLIDFPTFQQWVHNKVNWRSRGGKDGLPRNLSNELINRVLARYGVGNAPSWDAVRKGVDKLLRTPSCPACYKTTTAGCRGVLRSVRCLTPRLAQPSSAQPARDDGEERNEAGLTLHEYLSRCF